MDGNARILERFQLCLNTDVVDANTAAQTGDYIDMSKAVRALFVVAMGVGTAGSDLDMVFYQSDDASGTTTAVLNALETGRIYTKYAASLAAYAALTANTQVTQATADEKYEPTDSGESCGLMMVEIRPEDLTDGYQYVRLDLTDPGASKLAVSFAFVELKEPAGPTLTSSCT